MGDQDITHAEKMKSKGGAGRIFNAMRYSCQGFMAAWRDEHAFRQELMFCVPMAVVAACLPVTPTQKALLIGTMVLIVVVELINSAIEAVVDLVTVDHHAMAGKAKDIGSAAVMLCFGNAAVIWGLVIWERFGR
jgi:diacylglycerol kinase (ATP)